MRGMTLRLLQDACPRRHGLQKPSVMLKSVGVSYVFIISSARPPPPTCLIVLSSTRRLAEGMPGLCAKSTAVGRGWKARMPWKGTRKMSTLVRRHWTVLTNFLSPGLGISFWFSLWGGFPLCFPPMHILLACVFHWTVFFKLISAVFITFSMSELIITVNQAHT